MIALTQDQFDQVIAAGERAYPHECCGLLVGRTGDAGGWIVERVEECENLAAGERRDRFEIDPRLQVRLQRELRDSPLEVIGVFHSHPDGQPRPSAHDLAQADDPALVWLVTAVENGRAAATTAHVLEPGGSGFREIPLTIAPQ